MSTDHVALLKELLDRLKDGKHKALVEAYLAKADSRSMADKALEMLAGRFDENHTA